MPKIIGLTGRAGAGKDTAAEFFVGRGYTQYSLATPIKAALCAMMGWGMYLWEDRQWKETVIPEFGKSPRQMAQTLGTEWGRELVNQDLWLILARKFISESLNPVVISDVRFENEAALIRELGGTVVHVHRLNVAAVASHESERGVRELYMDYRVYNSGTIEELHSTLGEVFNV